MNLSRMGFAWLTVLACAALCAHAQNDVHQLHGAGTTNPSKFFWKVMDIMEEQAKLPLFMTYRAVGSSTGQKEFTGTAENNFQPLNHFGAGDIPMTQARYDQVTSTGAEMLHIPFLVGPIAVFHSVPAGELPAGGIELDACLMSKIFRRVITTWDHPDILTLNPDLSVPTDQPIMVAHRTLGSSSTSGVTEYLAKATKDNADASCVWDEGNTGSTVTWDSATQEVSGSGGMAAYLAATHYAIGYLDAGHGHSLGLEEIALQNKAGRYLKSKDADVPSTAAAAVANGVLPTQATDSFATVNLYDLPGDLTWPITLMSYFYIRKDLTSIGATGSLLKTFVEYVLSDAGQALLPEFLFSPLPASVLSSNAAALATLSLDASAPAWSIEGGTTLPMDGAGQYVLSGKRQSYAEYERSQMTASISALSTQMGSLYQGRTYELHGAGTTNPSKFFWKVMDRMEEQAKVPLFMTYRAVGSSTGQKEFTGTADNGFQPLNHFGAGDIPMTQARYDQVTSTGEQLLHVPFLIGPIAVFHTVPAGELPAGGIELDACLLSKILRRVITTWDDPAIMSLNPNLNVPADQPIMVAHRTLGSSSTAGLTEYLAKATKDSADATCVWPESNSGSTVNWDSGTHAVFGSGGMATYLDTTPYSIGYLDAGHGHTLGLEEIALKNQERYLKSRDADIPATVAVGLTSSIIPASGAASFAAVNFYNLPGENTWPITLMSYFYIRKDLSATGATGPLLKAFVEYVLSDEIQAMVSEFTFSPLPEAMRVYNRATLATLVMPEGEDLWTFEGGDTQAMAGASPLVLSSKRQSYAEYERGLMKSQLTEMEALIATMKTELEKKGSDGGDSSNDAVGIVAIILALIAVIGTGILWYTGMKASHGNAPGACLACAACRKPETLATQYHVRLDNELGAEQNGQNTV